MFIRMTAKTDRSLKADQAMIVDANPDLAWREACIAEAEEMTTEEIRAKWEKSMAEGYKIGEHTEEGRMILGQANRLATAYLARTLTAPSA